MGSGTALLPKRVRYQCQTRPVGKLRRELEEMITGAVRRMPLVLESAVTGGEEPMTVEDVLNTQLELFGIYARAIYRLADELDELADDVEELNRASDT